MSEKIKFNSVRNIARCIVLDTGRLFKMANDPKDSLLCNQVVLYPPDEDDTRGVGRNFGGNDSYSGPDHKLRIGDMFIKIVGKVIDEEGSMSQVITTKRYKTYEEMDAILEKFWPEDSIVEVIEDVQ